MEVYGYVRVSTKDQNPERQIVALCKEGVKKKNLYIDRISGKDFQRPQYNRLLSKIKRGDTLIIKSIDRLGRNYDEILEQWRRITKEKAANIKVIDMPLLNTTAVHENLTEAFISDLVLQILAYVAETERNFIKQRQAEGIAAAKMNGIKFGIEKKHLPEGFEECYQAWKAGKMSSREGARCLGISHSTFYRRCKEKEKLL